jgi:phosphopantetheinyl transferase (holo-ACP synthase)
MTQIAFTILGVIAYHSYGLEADRYATKEDIAKALNCTPANLTDPKLIYAKSLQNLKDRGLVESADNDTYYRLKLGGMNTSSAEGWA